MTIKSCLVWTLPEAHTEPKQTSWVRDIRCFRDLLVFHEPLGIRVLLKVNMFSYKTLKSQWYWIYSHIWPWNPTESYYILIKSCWEWLYSYIWLWNPVESDYILLYDFEMLRAISPGAKQFSVVHQCIQAGQVSFWQINHNSILKKYWHIKIFPILLLRRRSSYPILFVKSIFDASEPDGV